MFICAAEQWTVCVELSTKEPFASKSKVKRTPLTPRQYQTALQKGRAALGQPYAISARFIARGRTLAIAYSNGMTVSFSVRSSEILSHYPDADLSEPEVSPGGDGVSFPHADLAFATRALVAPFLPEDAARQKVASILGKTRSENKAQASRSNGAKGGRPRKAA